MPVNYVRRVRKRAQKENARFMGGWKKQVADLKMLADSASRAGDMGAAMRLYHKMGVIYDNAERYEEATWARRCACTTRWESSTTTRSGTKTRSRCTSSICSFARIQRTAQVSS